MQHRIFIAINLPEKIKNKLSDYRIKWPELPCHWTKTENLHITLAFLGPISEEEILEILKTAKDVALRHEPFGIKLNKIIYGPPRKNPPRMVWAEGEKNEKLGRLQGDIENSLQNFPEQKENENRSFAPHITLGRLKEWEFRKIELEERPQIEEDVSINFNVNSIEIMESELKREGPEYSILESIPLG